MCVSLFCSFVYDGIEEPNAKSISATVEILPTTEFWLLFFPLFQWSVSSISVYVNVCCVLCVRVFFFSLFHLTVHTVSEWVLLFVQLYFLRLTLIQVCIRTPLVSVSVCGPSVVWMCIQNLCDVDVFTMHTIARARVCLCVLRMSTVLRSFFASVRHVNLLVYIHTHTRNLQMLAKLFSSNQKKTKNKWETQHTDTRELALRLRRAPHTQWVHHSHKEKYCANS